MVLLVSPSETENYYLVWNDALIGPFSKTGTRNSVRVELPSELDEFVESRGIWHENDVQHSKLTGEFNYSPIAEHSIPVPTELAPHAMKFPLYNYGGTLVWVTALCGQFQDQAISWVFNSTKTIRTINFYQVEDSGDIAIWNITVAKSAPSRVYSAFVYRLKSVVIRTTTDGCTLTKTSQQFGGTFQNQPSDLFSGELSPAILLTAVMSASNHYSESPRSTSALTWRRGSLAPSFTQKMIVGKLYLLLVHLILGDFLFPIEGKHLGDLAMAASQKVNANRVNMIAFLRDLRKPQELIPKLKNLLSLKTISGNYLGYQYGILPTISDIQTIIGAFKRVAPYVDRNGFSTYSAGFTDSLVDGYKTYTLEQHVKLAIEDEDNEFQALIGRVESLGFLPSFENIWDLLPYSFVLDWLIDVGGFLERIDTRLRLTRLNVRYATMSTKRTQERTIFFSKDSSFTGTVKWVQYHRWVADHCPVPPLSLNPTFQDFNHWLESGALLIQRIKK